MKNHKLPLITLILLLCGSQLCKAQQEDTLKLKHPSIKQELIIPDQPMQSNRSLMPSKLSIDGFEYLSSTPKDTVEIVPNLSVENFIKFYHKDFLKWEKDTYGVNLNIQDFVMQNGKYLTKTKYIPRKRGTTEPPLEDPYPYTHLPLHSVNPNLIQIGVGLVVPVEWKPSKQDIWFKKNFSWEKRVIQIIGSQVDSFGYRSIYEVQNILRVDSIIKQNMIDSTGQFSPTPINYKKEIKQSRKNIREGAKQDLK